MAKKPGALQALYCTIAIALVLGGSLAGTRFQSGADTMAIIRPDPVDLSVAPGERAAISVWIKDVAGLYGAEIHLRFDPSILEIQDADPDTGGVQVRPGDFLDPAQGFVAANRVDNEAGEILYGITLLSPASPVHGSDALIWIDFVALAVGRSEWALQDVILATVDGASIPVQVETGWVVVEDGQSTAPPPTSTPAPTETTPVPAPSASVAAPVPSATPPPGAANTSLPTPEPSGTAPVPTDATVESPTQVATTMSTVEAPGTEQAKVSAAGGEATATPSATQWPTLAVPTRARRAGATPEAEKGGVQAALPAILVAAGAVLMLAVGLYLYRRRRRQHER